MNEKKNKKLSVCCKKCIKLLKHTFFILKRQINNNIALKFSFKFGILLFYFKSIYKCCFQFYW